jgi:hypothetical protein
MKNIYLEGCKIALSGRSSEEHSASIFRVRNLCLLAACSVYFMTLKMEAICSSGTPVDIYQTTRRYIPEEMSPL